MPRFGAFGSRARTLSTPGEAAKAWAQLAQDSLARPGWLSIVRCMLARYAERLSRLRATMRAVTSAMTRLRFMALLRPKDADLGAGLLQDGGDRQGRIDVAFQQRLLGRSGHQQHDQIGARQGGQSQAQTRNVGRGIAGRDVQDQAIRARIQTLGQDRITWEQRGEVAVGTNAQQ